MLNKLSAFLRSYEMLSPGDHVTCAVSGGADSMALLWAMYLLQDKLGITLSAAHFDHGLRGEESRADAAFVADFCRGYGIPVALGSGEVKPGKKGLEAAAREARYAFLRTQPGKIATAHTADDNAETVLLHLVRGTALKGLGGITPVSGNVIRPMLLVTRQEVEDFLAEYSIPHIEDSSNASDAFLRNRLRHHVMPLLYAENPRIGENLSATALRLRQDEAALSRLAAQDFTVPQLRELPPAVRSRYLERFLKENGVKEPDSRHIALAEKLVFSGKPSAKADLPGGVTIGRCYDRLERLDSPPPPTAVILRPGESVNFAGFRVSCEVSDEVVSRADAFTVAAEEVTLRSRQPGDEMRLSVGTKSLKKLFIDKKIPAAQRESVIVAADSRGVLGVCGIGANLERLGPGLLIRFGKR